MKRLWNMAGAALLGMVFMACSNPAGGGTAGGGDTIVNALDLTSLVTAPAKGDASAAGIDSAQYTVTVDWKESDGTTPAPAAFAATTVYKAVITLTAKPGYTFEGFTGTFIYNLTGASVSPYASGEVTITFPATADEVVNAGLELKDHVTTPVKGVAPDTTAINETQYSGTVEWKESDGTTPAPAAFAAGTQYKAVITLTAKTGYTFDGFTGPFTYTKTGVTVSSYAAGMVTITFPYTGS